MGQEMCDCLDVGSVLVPVVIISVEPPPSTVSVPWMPLTLSDLVELAEGRLPT